MEIILFGNVQTYRTKESVDRNGRPKKEVVEGVILQEGKHQVDRVVDNVVYFTPYPSPVKTGEKSHISATSLQSSVFDIEFHFPLKGEQTGQPVGEVIEDVAPKKAKGDK